MKTEERSIVKTEYVKIYIANDGTEFSNESECMKYEGSVDCAINAIFKSVPQQKTGSPDDVFPYFGYEDTIFAVKIRNCDDLEAVNRWLSRRGGRDANLYGVEAIGTIQLFCIYEYDNAYWSLGTPEGYKKYLSDCVDKLISSLVEIEGETVD